MVQQARRRISGRAIRSPEDAVLFINKELTPWLTERQDYPAPSVFDVRQYGAIGDGLRDNTTAIATAIAQASLVGGTVYFPVGTFMTGPITLVEGTNDGISLVGEGRYGQFGGGGSVVKLNASATHLLSVNGLRYQFYNMTFDGGTLPTNSVIRFVPTASEWVFDHVSIQGAGATGSSNASKLVNFTGTSEIDNGLFFACRLSQDLKNFAPRCPRAFYNNNPNAFNIAVEHSWVGCADILFDMQQGSIDVRHTQFFEFTTAAWYIETYAQVHEIADCYTERNGGTVSQSSVFYQQAFNAAAVTGSEYPSATIRRTQINDAADILSVGTQTIVVDDCRLGGNVDHSPAADQPLTGTVTTNGTITVTGTSGLFVTEAPAGTFLIISNEVHQVVAVAADGLSLTLATAMQSSAIGTTAARTYGFRKIYAHKVSFTTVGKGFSGAGYPKYVEVRDCDAYGTVRLSNSISHAERLRASMDATQTIGVKDGKIFPIDTLTGNRTYTVEKWKAQPGDSIFLYMRGVSNAYTADVGGFVTLQNQPGFLVWAEIVFSDNFVWELGRTGRDSPISASKVYAINTSQQSIPASTFTVVTGWTESVDSGSCFDPTTGIYTANKTGPVTVMASLEYDGAFFAVNEEASVFARVGAGDYRLKGTVRVANVLDLFTQASLSGIVQLTAGDTMVIVAYQSSTGAIPLAANNTTSHVTILEVP